VTHSQGFKVTDMHSAFSQTETDALNRFAASDPDSQHACTYCHGARVCARLAHPASTVQHACWQ
jgi:hypothetical protein